MAGEPPLDSLRRVRAPALVGGGTAADPFRADGSAAVARTLPGARLLAIRGAGHDPWYTRPRPFFAAARSFVDGLAAP
ncbi:MAG TPA: hypothetical protein VF746_31065 [Longimicrobium sp.]